MALTYRLEGIRCPTRTCYVWKDGVRHLRPATEALIFACGICVGLPCITEENWGDVLARLEYYHDHGIYFVQNEGPDGRLKPRRISITQIKGHIGLVTNGERFGWKTVRKRVRRQVMERQRRERARDNQP